MDRYTREMASFASSLKFEGLPADVVDHAKLCLLDTLGCGLFGSTLMWSRIVADFLSEVEGDGPCAMWGLTKSSSPAGAALVNGTMVHGFELDDLHKVSHVHPGSVVDTSALAVSEYVGGVDGRKLLTALVAGYEVVARVGMCMGSAHMLRGYHATGTHGTVGAAAACGSLLGLSPLQMHHALGIAGTQAAGLLAAQYSSMVKRFHAGRAAQSGVYGALLASRGFTGIMQLFESEYGGYCSTLSPHYDQTKLTAGLGEVWETRKIGFKPYSTNGSCQPVIDALLDLRKRHSFGPDDVRSIRLSTSTPTKMHVGWPYVPDSVTTAQMNVAYIAAVTIADGDAFVDQFTEERIRDERLVELAKRVEVIADPTIDALGDEFRHTMKAQVQLADGRLLEQSRDNAKGSAAHPLSHEEIETKFARLAGKALSSQQVGELRNLVNVLEGLDDTRALAGALVPHVG